MKYTNKRSFLLGVLTALLVICMVPAALALTNKRIDVSTGIRIYVNDSQINPTDSAGNPIEAFIYNGTTYLPVRAISDALGTPVQWDGSTQSVYIGRHTSSAPAAYLSQMDYFKKTRSWSFDKIIKDNLGNEHTHSIYRTSDYANVSGGITYKLNGQYTRLTASFFQKYSDRSDSRGATLIISGDGRELWQGFVGAGIDPIQIDINVTGVLELTLEFPRGDNALDTNTALGEVALYT